MVGGAAVVIGALFEPLLLLALVPYAALIVVASTVTWRNRDKSADASLPALPAALVVTHFAWGLDCWRVSLLRRRPALASGSAQTAGQASSVGGLA